MNAVAYSLTGKGAPVTVSVEVPDWLPVRPTVPKAWLRNFLAGLFRR